jgi:hypothetical protein
MSIVNLGVHWNLVPAGTSIFQSFLLLVPAGSNKNPWPEPGLCCFQRDRISSLFIE